MIEEIVGCVVVFVSIFFIFVWVYSCFFNLYYNVIVC